MTDLNGWLTQATRRLSKDSAARVRDEIQEHYELARDASISSGASAAEAERAALAALGDAKTANSQYRRVLLTSLEAGVLRDGNREARAICSRPLVKRLLFLAPAAALLASAAQYLDGATALARILLAGGLVMGILLAAPFLPVYTPARARVFRCVKWASLAGLLILTFEPHSFRSASLLSSCLWPLLWIEWTRNSIRRKLPVTAWPKQLYL